jgi:tRNA (guanine37-N1)-methyltransferase
LPIKEKIKGKLKRKYEYAEMDFEKVGISAQSYKELVNIPSQLKRILPSSFDVVGDIGIMKLPDELLKYKKEIGEGLLSFNKHLKVVLMDKGVKGNYRLRDIDWLVGEKRTETVHREYGMKIMVDIAGVYYSPRLSMERYRVARQVKDGEVVVDLFAGAAPFSILNSLIAKPSKVYAIDINPRATEYARINAMNNHVEDIVEIINDDARNAIKMMKEKKIIADHVIMNLPHSSREFFADALSISKKIHYYEIMEKMKIKDRLKWLKEIAIKNGFRAKIEDFRVVGSYSSKEVIYGIDIEIER